MAKRYDAVVIGGGHNGLVNAAYLAKAGTQGPRARAPPPAGRRDPDRGDRAGVPVLRLLLRRVAAAAGDHPRAGAAQARPRDPAAGRHDHAPRRRLPVAGQRPRQDRARAAPLVAERRRGLRGVRPADGGDGPVHQADPVGAAARPRQDLADGVAAADAARQAVPRPAAAHADRVHPADDDVGGRLPRSVVRDRAAQGDDERVRDHRHVPGPALAGHRLRAAAPLHGRDRRRVPRLGRAQGRHRRDRVRDRRGRACRRRRDPHRGAGRRGSRRPAARRPAWCSSPARRSRPTS